MGSNTYAEQHTSLFSFQASTDSGIKSRGKVTAPVKSVFRKSLGPFLVAICYYAGTKIGFYFTPSNTPISTFWPPNAFLLAAFLLTPRRMWWALMLAVLPAHLLAQWQTGVPIARVLGWFAGNTGEALLGAICIDYFRKQDRLFGSARGLVIFLAFGVLGAPLVTSFLDAAVVTLTGLNGDYWVLWLTRLSSNVVANITIVPAVLLFCRYGKSWLKNATLQRWIEAGALVLGVVIVSALVFSQQPAAGSHISALSLFALLPLLLWAAVRFNPGTLSASMLMVAFIASWNAMHGRGLLAAASPAEEVMYLNVLLFSFALPSMVLAAVLAERKRTEVSLKNTRKRLMHEQEQERYRVARELHDDLAQRLILLGLELDQIGTELHPALRQRVQMLHDRLAGVSHATRDLSHEMHPFWNILALLEP
jgi:integral membrane sensor domain MASE1